MKYKKNELYESLLAKIMPNVRRAIHEGFDFENDDEEDEADDIYVEETKQTLLKTLISEELQKHPKMFDPAYNGDVLTFNVYESRYQHYPEIQVECHIVSITEGNTILMDVMTTEEADQEMANVGIGYFFDNVVSALTIVDSAAEATFKMRSFQYGSHWGNINGNIKYFDISASSLGYCIENNVSVTYKNGELPIAVCNASNAALSEEIQQYFEDSFDKTIFARLLPDNRQELMERFYFNGHDDALDYLKKKKYKFEDKDMMRVEDLMKQNKSCETMASKIGAGKMYKAGMRYAAAMILYGLPIPYELSDQLTPSDNLRIAKNFSNMFSQAILPDHFLAAFLGFGGTIEDVRYMYDAILMGGQAEKRSERIYNFSGINTKKYGRLAKFVLFLDQLPVKYQIDPISQHVTHAWHGYHGGSYDAWQGVTLLNDDGSELAHFAITSSNGARETNSTYYRGGGYSSGHMQMLGDLELYKVSDSLKPYMQTGPTNLGKVRAAINKFLKDQGLK